MNSLFPSQATNATKRLKNELHQLLTSDNPSISGFPTLEQNLLKWTAFIEGAQDTPYEGLKFKLSLNFTSQYPFMPPSVKFVTPIFHPNVDTHGNICLDILKEKWSPVMTVQGVLISIQSLLNEPNNLSPLNAIAASTWSNKDEFRRNVLIVHKEV